MIFVLLTIQTTATAGSVYVWGSNIGYNSAACASSSTTGYWPPGPACPKSKSTTVAFSLAPKPDVSTTGTGCPVGNGAVGYFVNGAAIFGFSDTQSYSNQNIWHNIAQEFEVYDMDVCNGHASPNFQYHHHAHSPCLAARLNDVGSSHSPIYGWMNDGYPIYGPYNGPQVYASPCWKKRDYSSATTGCTGGQRTCQLSSQVDITKGTKTVTSGPNVGSTITTLSSNTISTNSGIYAEDYYYDASCYAQGGANLDSHNGHSHGNLGYHYHLTIDSITQKPVFPYIVGPTLYGCTGCAGGSAVCGTSTGVAMSSATCLNAKPPTRAPSSSPV